MGLFHPSAGGRMKGRGACGVRGGREDGKTDSILPPPGPAPSIPCASLSPARAPRLPHECRRGGMPAFGGGAEGQVGPHPGTGDPRSLGQHSASRTAQPSLPVTHPAAPLAGVRGGWAPQGRHIQQCSAPCPGASGRSAVMHPPPRPGEPLPPSHRAGRCGVGMSRGRGNAVLGTAARRGRGSEGLTRSILLTLLSGKLFEVALPQLP